MASTATFAKRALALAASACLAGGVQAELRPMADNELAAVTGQAMITMDGLTYGGFEYTRVNIGADIDLLTNIEELRLGNYSRSGGGTASTQPADIRIDNFSLGRIDNANSPDANVLPFQIRDPYLELAFKPNAQGVRELVGVRLGFGRARGDLSGDIRSLTGVMQGKIYGPASIAYQYYRETNGCGFLGLDANCIALSLAGNTEVYAEVELLQEGTGKTTLNGQPINRATHIGIPEGESLQTDESGLIASLIPTLSKTSDCQALGLTTCFALLNYKSIFVGDRTQADLNLGGAQGIFFSLQNQNVPWQDLANAGKFVETQSGAFANFAKTGTAGNTVYPFLINLYDALRGTGRVPTCMGGQAKGC